MKRFSQSVESLVQRVSPSVVQIVVTGVLVIGRSQGARAVDIPLSTGDVIHAINGTMVSTFQVLDGAINGLEPQSPVALQIERGGKLMFVSFTVE